MTQYGVSVVIPVYNGAAHLAEAVKGVLAQTVAPAVVIVVDDGSEDETPLVAAQFASSIRYVRQAHAGAAQARNIGMEFVESEFFAFLDSDDVWSPRKLETQLAELHGCTQPAMVFVHAIQFASPELAPWELAFLDFDRAPKPAILPSALLMRTREFWRVGPFDARLRSGEFIEWYARAQDEGLATRIVPEVTLCRRLHRANHGRLRVEARQDYVRALKGVLDRRRESA